jgi:uncharacterized protein (DUF111 family)
VLRPNSGISGDMMVAGLAVLAGVPSAGLDDLLVDLGLSSLVGRVRLERRVVEGVSGHGLAVDVPSERVHRTLRDVTEFFGAAAISDRAKALALSTFELLAAVEARVHDRSPQEVTFHEVGALDSLLDVGLAASLYDRLDPSAFVCGPLPLCDGAIPCAHGLLPSPAPAVAILLEGALVRGLDSTGETVTPTGLALLKTFGASFGPWPEIIVTKQALIFGARLLPNVPNGALFAAGEPAPQSASGPCGTA